MKLRVFRAEDDGLWYWQAVAANGAVVGQSMIGYPKRDRAVRFAELLSLPVLPVEIIE